MHVNLNGWNPRESSGNNNILENLSLPTFTLLSTRHFSAGLHVEPREGWGGGGINNNNNNNDNNDFLEVHPSLPSKSKQDITMKTEVNY